MSIKIRPIVFKATLPPSYPAVVNYTNVSKGMNNSWRATFPNQFDYNSNYTITNVPSNTKYASIVLNDSSNNQIGNIYDITVSTSNPSITFSSNFTQEQFNYCVTLDLYFYDKNWHTLEPDSNTCFTKQ